MWIYTHYTLALRNRHPEEISGEYRAVLELAAAMQTELDIEDTDPSVLREKQLKDRIDKEIRGGAVSYAYPDTTLKSYSIWKSLKVWFKSLKVWFKINRWWFLAILSTTIVCSIPWGFWSSTAGFWFSCWLWSIWFGQFRAFCIGTTVGSRLLIILFWSFVGGLAVGIPGAFYY